MFFQYEESEKLDKTGWEKSGNSKARNFINIIVSEVKGQKLLQALMQVCITESR